MALVGRILRLPARDLVLLSQVLLLLSATRLGLTTLRFATLRNALSRLAVPSRASRRTGMPDEAERRRIVWAVEAVGRRFPSIGTCLTHALTAYVLLARRGYASNLRIGVTRGRTGEFVAHAWLEKDGAIVIGGDTPGTYTPMPALNGLES